MATRANWPPLRLHPGHSLIGQGVVIGMAGLAAAGVSNAPLPDWVQGGTCLLLLAAIWWHWSGRQRIELELSLASGIRMKVAGDWQDMHLSKASRATRWWVILHLAPQNGGPGCVVVILPDSIAASDYRKLLVMLRWHFAPLPR